MTKTAALYAFFSQFGIPAYVATSVPDDADFPYLTYTANVDAWDGEPVGLTVNLWFNTESEAEPNKLVSQISEAVSAGRACAQCEGGFIWFTRGSPFCQSLADDNMPNIKRRYMNITAHYETLN